MLHQLTFEKFQEDHIKDQKEKTTVYSYSSSSILTSLFDTFAFKNMAIVMSVAVLLAMMVLTPSLASAQADDSSTCVCVCVCVCVCTCMCVFVLVVYERSMRLRE